MVPNYDWYLSPKADRREPTVEFPRYLRIHTGQLALFRCKPLLRGGYFRLCDTRLENFLSKTLPIQFAVTKGVQLSPIIQCIATVLVLTKPSETPNETTRIGSWQQQLKRRLYLSSKHSNGMMLNWHPRFPPMDEPRSLIPKRPTIQPFAHHLGQP